MRCGCVIDRLIKHDRWILALFWSVYVCAAATWAWWDLPKSLVFQAPAAADRFMRSYHHWGQALLLLMTLAFPLLALRNCFFRKKTEKGLRELAQGVSAEIGDSFFHSLGRHLSQALGVDYVIIGRLAAETENRVDTVVAYADGAAMDNFSYALTGTPCATVLRQRGTSYRCRVRELFPEDQRLQSLAAEGYAGTPLFGSDGRPLGLLAVLDRKPIRDLDFVESLLKVFAVRAAGELERKKSEEQVRYLAHYDTLTGLPNQALFTDRLTLQVAHSHRLVEKFAVFNLDIDHFKRINNAFGHALGDALLKAIAARLSAVLREDDTVAKMGGDSFIMLLPDIRQAERAAKVARKILDSFHAPFILEQQEIFLSASLGIAIYPSDGAKPQLLLKNADTALQRAKEQGRNDFQFYRSQMNARAQDQLAFESQLRTAIERDEFILHYQPQVDAGTGELTGVEALVRWRHPQLGLIPPDRFIPLAEETGAIVALGEWILRSACRQARIWQRQGFPPLRVSVNLSPRQFRQHDFVKRFDEILAEAALCPSCIGLEITESAVMEDPAGAAGQLDLLRHRGVHISIDDFGTGYSSLGYLKRFSIDMLKIDRSFVADLPHAADDIAIVQAVIAMAHKLNIKVLAEGVESGAQRLFLNAQGCDELQGFLFGRPLPAEDLYRLFGKTAFRSLGDGRRQKTRRPAGSFAAAVPEPCSSGTFGG
jgi:diguanylate cyclase (GGDEF)-like protein